MFSDGSTTAPSLSDSIMGATSVLTDSALQCVTVTVFLCVCICMCLFIVGPNGSNVIEQEALSAKVDEMCKEMASQT